MGAAVRPEGGTLLTLAGFFGVLSLFAVGGGNSAVPEMHRFVVDVQHWLSDRQFADSFALAQLTPGPNIIIVTLIGYHVAGVIGALITTMAMCGPPAVFAFFVGGASDRFKGKAWHGVVSRALGAGDDRAHRRQRGHHRGDGGLQLDVAFDHRRHGADGVFRARPSVVDVRHRRRDRHERTAVNRKRSCVRPAALSCSRPGAGKRPWKTTLV